MTHNRDKSKKNSMHRTPNPPPCMGVVGEGKGQSSRLDVLKVHVRNKKLSTSSKNWMNRQLNDPYVHRAKAEGYRSRAAYKILEIHEKFKIFSPKMTVVDLGSAPGGWSQVVSKICAGRGPIYAVDLLEMEPIPGVTFLQGDFHELIPHLPHSVDVVMSDMAPSSCGVRSADHARIMGMLEDVVGIASQLLAQGGTLIAKVLKGGTEKDLLSYLKHHFDQVHHFKPKSSRPESKEFFVIAKGFRQGLDR